MDKKQIHSELQCKAVRSSGAGGQHVNKVSTKVELAFDVAASQGLSAVEKERLLLKLKSRLTKDGVLQLHCDESRSQHKNRDLVVKRLFDLLKNALTVPKKRKPTKPTRSSVEKRLKSKKQAAEKKSQRKKPGLE
ncbi:alternative ribosome rescue aminoacyl-tRNA hydrolase ArfB [Flagellimonas olearia]|uniref:Peptide chain release factor 1 n=1 Tax=Flagellimonas olearia TaxID=552546 RepID=A0A444VNM0_9FLAO|nr:alternative ribosome rescue aminoacyl-tRNA hydrolase ArfB [Allomuricauda olearia]RYC52280.1 peptide chain release factor 1 [Allomuricauda olearia]